MAEDTCKFQFEDGKFCSEPSAQGSQLCLFHDPHRPKNTPEMQKVILGALKSGKRIDRAILQSADLSHEDLSGVWLVGADLKNANLERANLEKAHLYGANLSNANLFNANLRGANLKNCVMAGADILEIKIDDAKISGIDWGKSDIVRSEKEAIQYSKKGEREKAAEKFREAEDIYQNLRVHLASIGSFDDSGDFFYREMVVRRKQMAPLSLKRFSSKVIDLLCGYGEKTFRVISYAAGLIFFCSFFYFFSGIRQHREIIVAFSRDQTLAENLKEYALSLYFSVVTFTTLGYGDIAPVGAVKAVAALEAFTGAFMMALFVLVFARKMIR
jgi:hypothetical protein